MAFQTNFSIKPMAWSSVIASAFAGVMAITAAGYSPPLAAEPLGGTSAGEFQLAQNTSRENALFSQAFSFYRGGNYRAAAKEFQYSLESDDSNLSANYYLAESLRELGQKEQATEYYQRVTQIAPNSPEAMLARTALTEMRGETGVNRRYQSCVAGVEQWHRECIRKFDVSVVGGGYDKACGKDHKRLMAKCRDEYR